MNAKKRIFVAASVFSLLATNLTASYNPEKQPLNPTIYIPESHYIPQQDIIRTGFKPFVIQNTPQPPKKAPSAKIRWKSINATFYRWQDFVGRHTADGTLYTKDLQGIASNALKLGTWVTLKYCPKINECYTKDVQVHDRHGRTARDFFDLTSATCAAIHHCFTGHIDWIVKKP